MEPLDPLEAILTTRAIRRFTKQPVDDADIEICLQAAQQGPSGGNVQPQQYFVVTDADKRAAIGGLYKRAYDRYSKSLPSASSFSNETQAAAWKRTSDASQHLADHLGEVPIIVLFLQPIIPWGAADNEGSMDIGRLDASVYPAIQNFCVAARSLGLGTALTTVIRIHSREVFELLGIPTKDDGSSRFEIAALIPVGHPLGRFGVAPRKPAAVVTHWDTWGNKRVDP